MSFSLLFWLPALHVLFGTAYGMAGQIYPHQSHISRDTISHRDLETNTSSFPAMVNALEIMLSAFWDSSNSTWPTGIDWTRATFNTDVSTTLSMMASYGNSSYSSEIQDYFAEAAAFYNGENAIGLTTQKYDDMQWVILEWLEAIKFINMYSSVNSSFDGSAYIPKFAHRARVFWDLVSQGYNTTLCGGGMVWTNQLAPYKNAITNQLFVSASIGMYLYFPGDSNTDPSPAPGTPYNSSQKLSPIGARDPRYLNAAIEEYNWLSTSNMTNSQGLYVDGFHITNWTSTTSPGTGKCDARDESVYTYNQGVLLSGLRGLWDVTGDQKYLIDGYTLMNSVINATGYNSTTAGTWAGLGSDGILQDLCDVDGSCSQDAQNFKGIFFHHLTLFCQPVSMDESQQNGQNTTVIFKPTMEEAQAHMAQCQTYTPWILHNAQAAYATRNSSGIYGGWWDPSQTTPKGYTSSPPGAAYAVSKGIPQNTLWRLPGNSQIVIAGTTPAAGNSTSDPNARGRGRTVETQSGGLALMTSLVNAQEG